MNKELDQMFRDAAHEARQNGNGMLYQRIILRMMKIESAKAKDGLE